MESLLQIDGQSYGLALHCHPGAGWQHCERALMRRGVAVPFSARSDAELGNAGERCLLEVRRGVDTVAGVGISIARSRALPGHATLFVNRFGGAADEHAQRAALAGLLHVSRQMPRILWLNVRFFSRNTEELQRFRRWAMGMRMKPMREARGYTKTLCLDLERSEEEIWAGLHKKVRRDVRVIDKHPVELRPLVDPAAAPVLAALFNAAIRRTGGNVASRDWSRHLALARTRPDLLRIVGLYRHDGSELLAFASAYAHGDHAEYADAGSARPSDLRIPLSYALVWDLICWARETGASFFDFGGVTDGTARAGTEPHADSDRLGGISDFKRYFRGDALVVADEWVYEPHPLRSLVAHGVSAGANYARTMRTRFFDASRA